MPELPEVEALARTLNDRLSGQPIAAITAHSIAAVKTYEPPLGALRCLVVQGCGRHGKFLDIVAPPLHLVIHLARAGWLRWYAHLPDRRPSIRGRTALQFRLEGGSGFEATEQGTERRLAVYVVRDVDDVPGVSRLGIDVLDPALDAGRLSNILHGVSGTIKNALSDQSLIAGIGNAYSDEILHAARLSPYRRAADLDNAEVGRLHTALDAVLGEAVRRTVGLEPDEVKPDKRSHMRVHGRTGMPCPVCATTVCQVSFASRSLQYCPTCQTQGRILADRRMSRLLR